MVCARREYAKRGGLAFQPSSESLLICYRTLKIQLLTNLLHSFVESELKEVPPRFWSRNNLVHRTDKDIGVTPFHWVTSGELSSVVSVMPFPFVYIRLFFMCHFLMTLLSRLHQIIFRQLCSVCLDWAVPCDCWAFFCLSVIFQGKRKLSKKINALEIPSHTACLFSYWTFRDIRGVVYIVDEVFLTASAPPPPSPPPKTSVIIKNSNDTIHDKSMNRDWE